MPWVRIDDRFHAHPKLAALGSLLLPAVGLYVLALSWSADYLTDGEIPEGQVVRLGGSPKEAEALVKAGLWERTEGGYRIHDFLEYNRSRASVEADRAAKTKAGHLGGLRSGEARRNSNEADVEPRPSDDEAAVRPKRSSGRTASAYGVTKNPIVGQSIGNRTRTPEPEPEPEPMPASRSLEDKRTSPAADEKRPDIEALRRHQGLATDAQIEVLDEINDRHHKVGPSWATQIIDATPPGSDAFANVMAADRAWQASRRASVVEEERDWAAEKAHDRASAKGALDSIRARANGVGAA